MQQIIVEDSVPMPPQTEYRGRLTEELRSLKPGQSVLVDRPTASALINWLKRRGMKAIQRKEEDGSIRVWRSA